MGPQGTNRPSEAGNAGRSSPADVAVGNAGRSSPADVAVGNAGRSSPATASTAIVVLDVGTTTTSLALVAGGLIRVRADVPTRPPRTPGGYARLVASLCGARTLGEAGLDGLGVAGVVPGAAGAVRAAGRRAGVPVVEISARAAPLPLGYDDPGELGADRVANALGAIDRYGAPVIVVDLGTATTMEVVSAAGELVGGAIAPGVGIALAALRHHAPHLPPVALTPPGDDDPVVATTTATALRSGVLWGAGALVDGLVGQAWRTVGPCPVVATGGGARVAAAGSCTVTAVDEDLTLWGVYLGYLAGRT
jgi:type III pantothenate kinase